MSRIDEIKERYEDMKDMYVFEEYEELAGLTGEILSRLEIAEKALENVHSVISGENPTLHNVGKDSSIRHIVQNTLKQLRE